MPSIGGEKDSIKSLHSSVPSSVSFERPVSVHDHAVNNKDLEKTVTPEVLPLSLRLVISNNAASIATNATNDPDYEVDWDGENDPMNPRNWSIWYKAFTIFCISWSTVRILELRTSPVELNLVFFEHVLFSLEACDKTR